MEPITRTENRKIQRKVVIKYIEESHVIVLKKRIEKQGSVSAVESIIEICDDVKDVLQERDDIEQGTVWGKTTAQKTVALFVTFSPKPGLIQPDLLLLEAFNIVRNKKGIAGYYFSLEQSGTEEDKNIGYHPHFHMLIILDKTSPSGERGKMKSMIERHLKIYQAGTPRYLQIKAVSEAKLQSKIDYIMGNKTDESKHPQVAADKIWREQYKIQPWYTNDLVEPSRPIPPPRAPVIPKKIRDPLGTDL